MENQTENPIYPTPETTPAREPTEATPKTPWRAPTLTRITLKRTMNGSGGLSDFDNSAASNSLF